ncbi:GMC oxidoreductase [Achromobacter sp. F4_2707]|uniref:GMC oxidoreductase n=1 Tax=Achromobacter sp. F4_2707 TaxID=3114286 RepID=UPI0039C748F2
MQFTFTPASYDEGVIGRLADTPGMTVAVWQQRPESRGAVHIASNDPFQAPLIFHNYLEAELDRRVLVAGMRQALKARHSMFPIPATSACVCCVRIPITLRLIVCVRGNCCH